MDNNNQTNNQIPEQNNAQNGYTNFNNYQPQTPPQGAPVPPQTAYAPQYPYQTAPVQQQKSGTGFGIGGIVLGCIGCCCFPFGIVGIILSIIGVVRDKKSVVSWVGLVLSVITTIISIIYWGSIISIMQDPEATRQIYEESGLYTEEQIEAMMESLYGFVTRFFR